MPAHSNRKKMGLVYLVSILSITLWGMSYLWTDQLLGKGVTVSYFIFIRILLAGVILLLFNIASGKSLKIKKKDLPKFLALALCEPFIYFIFESLGIRETGSPTISAMIIATIPIFSIGAGRLFFKEKITALNHVGIAISLGGIALVTLEQMNGATEGQAPNMLLGIVFLVIAVIAEVGHASITKSLSGNYDSPTIVMYQFLIGSIYLFPGFLYKGLEKFDATIYLSLDVWIPILCLALLCSSLAFSLWVSTIKSLGVAKSSVFSALIPVVAAVISASIGRDNMNLWQWAGVFISTIGVILSQHQPGKQRNAHQS